MEVSGRFHAPAALISGRLSGPQSQSGRGGEEKISQLLPGLAAVYSSSFHLPQNFQTRLCVLNNKGFVVGRIIVCALFIAAIGKVTIT
jgi:hypothetical protein